MERQIQKRVRSVNWDEEEKILLREVLKDHVEIIANKDLNTNTLKEKNKAWAAVHERFNQLNCRPRDLKQIRIQWKTMKGGTKEYRYYPRKSTKRDGGPKPPSPTTEDYGAINLVNTEELMDYDSDGKQFIPNNSDKSEEPASINTNELIPGDILICNLEMELSAKQDLKERINDEYNDRKIDFTPGPSIPKAKFKRKDPKPFTRTHITNHSRKLEEYEHKRKMEMAEEEHSLKMTIMKEEHEIKMRIEREKLRRLLILNRIRNRKV